MVVLERYRRQGVATRLVESALAACRDLGLGWAVVFGEPAYYRRFGFRAAAEWGLDDEYGGGAAFQAIELLSGALPGGRPGALRRRVRVAGMTTRAGLHALGYSAVR